MTTFKHCPSCGSEAIKPDSAKSAACAACGFVYFFNASAAVAAIITNADDELLVAVRGQDPGKGRWDLPGGFVDPGETVEAALRREIREELDLEIQSMHYFASAPNDYVYRSVTYLTADLVFVCEVEDFSPLRAQDDIEAVVFVPLERLDPQQFYFSSIRRIISAFADKKSR